MKAQTLQQFLNSLSGSLAVIGVSPKSLNDLRMVTQALEPFNDLELDQLADFLKRAKAYREDGKVPSVTVAGLPEATNSALALSETLRSLSAANDITAEQIEARIINEKGNLQTAIGTLAKQFGFTVKFAEDKKWLSDLRAKVVVSQTVNTFRQLQPHITSPQAYQMGTVTAKIDQIASLDTKILKTVAKELGVTGTGTGKKFVTSLLEELTGIKSQSARPARQTKATKPDAPAEHVEMIVQALEEMIARARDPKAVSDSEIDAILHKVSSEFSEAQQKAIAKRVTGKGGRSAQNAIDNLRADLTAVKRLLEGQKV
jgi:hypothetical protein